MIRILAAAVAALALVPAAAQARDGDPDSSFGRRGAVTLKATAADAVGGAVKVISGNRVLAGGSAAGQFVVVRLRKTGSLDSAFGTSGQVVPALPGTSAEGVRALATFRDGRIVAAGTLKLADGTTRMVALRLLPTGEIDPSFGAGLGYVLIGPANAELGAMVMDRAGNVILGGVRPGAGGGEIPIVIRLLPDGSADPGFATGGTLDGGVAGLTGRATGLLVRPDGSVTLHRSEPARAARGRRRSPSSACCPPARADPSFGGTGIVDDHAGPGRRRRHRRAGRPEHDEQHDPRRGLRPDRRRHAARRGHPAPGRRLARPRFGAHGVARIARAGREIRITSMVRDNSGRILLAGSGRPPNAVVVRLRPSGARDASFGNGGLTYPLLGRPPGGAPIYTTIDAIDVAGSRPVFAGSAAGPGTLVRGASGTLYTGRFAFTVSKLR